jgi:hypothetical protein
MPRRRFDEEGFTPGMIEVWGHRPGGFFGVSLDPDLPVAPEEGRSYTSATPPKGFPSEFDEEALFAWGRAQWRRETFGPRK